MPNSVFVDQGHEFRGDFAAWLTDHGVSMTEAGFEAAWQLGLAERHGGIWKEI